MLSGFDKEIGISSSTSDGRVKVDAADVAGYLQDKLAQGSNIILTVNQNNIVINAEVQTAIDKTLESFVEGHEIQSDGTAVKQRPILNFAGASVSVADDEDTGATVVTIDSANGHVIYVKGDDAVPQRSGLKFIGGHVNTTDDPDGDKTIISIDGGYVIHFDGAAQTYRSILNFTGDAVTITDDENADSTIINIKKHIIQEEGGELPPRAHLNFVGSGIIATDDADNDRTNITLTNAGGSGHVIQDEGVVLTGRANLNFVGESVKVTDDATHDASVVTITTAGRLIVTRATNPTVTAVSGHHYVCEGVTTLNLPKGVEGASVGVSDIGNTFTANPITITPTQGEYVGKPYQTSLTLDRSMSCVTLGYSNGTWAYLSAESFNDLGISSGAGGGTGVGVEDGDKGDVIVTNNGANWQLDTTGITPGNYSSPNVTVDGKGRITNISQGQVSPTFGYQWQEVATNFTATVNNGYVIDASSTIEMMMPASANPGDSIAVFVRGLADLKIRGGKIKTKQQTLIMSENYMMFTLYYTDNSVGWAFNSLYDPQATYETDFFLYYVTSASFETGTTPTISTHGSFSSSALKWYGGVLAPNGHIYAIPGASTTVLKINPADNTTSTFGSLPVGNNKWLGGVLAPNGKIYCIPFGTSSILVIDPTNDTTSTFGNIPTADYAGGVLAPNGKIYAMPHDATTILEIDPETNSTTTFGNIPNDSNKSRSGVLAPNGMIYTIPLNSTAIYKIDPINKVVTSFGNIDGTWKWLGGVLGQDGKIYCIPAGSNNVLAIDPATDTYTPIGNTLSGVDKYAGGVLAPNGKIYGMPHAAQDILEIDPLTSSVTTIADSSSPATSYRYVGGVLAPNGKIYSIPHNGTDFLTIDVGISNPSPYLISAHTNKL